MEVNISRMLNKLSIISIILTYEVFGICNIETENQTKISSNCFYQSIDDFKGLSSPSKYNQACSLLEKSNSLFQRNLGAHLMLSLIKENYITAIDFLDQTCDIRDYSSSYTDDEIIEIIMRRY